jgi:hypothetical protein
MPERMTQDADILIHPQDDKLRVPRFCKLATLRIGLPYRPAG